MQQIKFSCHQKLIDYLAKSLDDKPAKVRTQIEVLIAYAERWTPSKNITYRSQIAVAVAIGKTTKTVGRVTKALEALGVITVTRAKKQNNRISFNFNKMLPYLKMSSKKCPPITVSKETVINNHIKPLAEIIFDAGEHYEKSLKAYGKKAFNTGFNAAMQKMRERFQMKTVDPKREAYKFILSDLKTIKTYSESLQIRLDNAVNTLKLEISDPIRRKAECYIETLKSRVPRETMEISS